jgi:endonuclease/exonuclease/phosphatase family metal-dependent hydrolase
MPPFPKPTFAYDYQVPPQITALRAHRVTRLIPNRKANRLLVGSWNLANFGQQQRRDKDRRIFAELLSWFDLAAVQEVKENFGDLFDTVRLMGPNYRVLMSDVAGNDERLAFIYDTTKVTLLENIGHIIIPPSDYRFIKLPGINAPFEGFDRNPYLGTFQAGNLTLQFATVHQFYGGENPADLARRALETYALARWADLRQKSGLSFTRNVVALGDFNMPRAVPGDPIYKALTAKGLELPLHTAQIGSNLAGDQYYDQVAFFPGPTKAAFNDKGVFDFDKVVFPDLWAASQKNFFAYTKFYLSDHRPVWVEFKIP